MFTLVTRLRFTMSAKSREKFLAPPWPNPGSATAMILITFSEVQNFPSINPVTALPSFQLVYQHICRCSMQIDSQPSKHMSNIHYLMFDCDIASCMLYFNEAGDQINPGVGKGLLSNETGSNKDGNQTSYWLIYTVYCNYQSLSKIYVSLMQIWKA